MGREPSVCSSSDDGLPQQEGTKRMKTDTFRESVSVEETNRMREKLGLKYVTYLYERWCQVLYVFINTSQTSS